MLERMAQDQNSPFLAALTQDIHVLPDFHGNRCVSYGQQVNLLVSLCSKYSLRNEEMKA